MKTISFRIKTNDELQKVISEDSRVYSSMVRYSFNRLKDNASIKDIYNDLGSKFDISSHLRNCASRQASGIFKLNKDKKVYFGKYLRFKKGLISKEEFKQTRDIGIFSEGETPYKGNRLFKIEVENNKFVYKRKCKEHYDLEITEKLSDKRKQILSRI